MNEQETAIFSFDCVHDLRTHKDFQKGFLRTRPANLILDAAIILAVIWCIFSIIPTDDVFSIGFFAFSVVYLVTTLIVWIINIDGDINYKRMLDSNGGKPPRNIFTFTDSSIHQLNPDTGNKGEIEYGKILRVIRTKENLILIMNYGQGFCIPKAALNGNEEQFLSFLREKCPNWKRKKPVSCLLGKILYIAKISVLILGLLITIIRPLFQLADLIPTPPQKGDMTCQEIVTMLDELGVTGDPEMIAELEADLEEYPELYYDNESRILDVLYCMGCGSYDYDTWEWIPATGGVYSFDLECVDLDTMYSDFLRGVSALDPELDFKNITEDLSEANYEINKGKQSADFTWDGTSYRITGKLDYDWFDVGAADDLKNIIKDRDTGRQLYFASGYGSIIVFYRDADWAKQFEYTTGIKLYESAVKAYYGIG